MALLVPSCDKGAITMIALAVKAGPDLLIDEDANNPALFKRV